MNQRLTFHALTNPTSHAVIAPDCTLNYLELAKLVEEQVKIFRASGIRGNTVVGIKCENEVQHLVLCLAATYIGCTSCTVPTYESDQIQKSIVNNCGATTILDEGIAVNPINNDIKNEPILDNSVSGKLLFSTSGTTGTPKLVVHKDENIVAQAHRHIGSTQERFLCLASVEHNFAKRHRLYCIAMGATNIFLDINQKTLVEECLSLKINVMHVSAFQAQELLAIPDIHRLSNIRLKIGGSHADYILRQKLRDSITQNLQAGYGTTETGAIAFTDPKDIDSGESVGQPLPGIEVRIVSPKDKVLDKGKRGEITIRCKGMFNEYFRNPELTNSLLKSDWFYTGDIGYIDSKQRIHLCGRSDDMFVFNSINIYPQEIESQIRQYTAIEDVAVLPKSSSMHGDIPLALVVFDKNVKPKLPALRKYARKKIGIRCPRRFIIVDKIPRNTSGKIARNKIITLSDKNEDVRKFIIKTLGERVTNKFKPSFISALISGDTDIKLNKFDLDSLARMELLVALEVNYEVVITPQEISQFRYFGHLVACVISRKSQHGNNKVSDTETIIPAQKGKLETNNNHTVRLVRRAFNFCHTVTQFNQILRSLANRITPQEIEILSESNKALQIIPTNAAEKYHAALSSWLKYIQDKMSDSGKQQPEHFVLQKVAPNVRYFVGPGMPSEKTLVVCFAGQGGRGMMMPSAVLLQHTDSAQYDMLIISEPLNNEYRHGVPHLGGNVNEVIRWIANLGIVKSYDRIRTMGCSAGGYVAVIAGYHLNAELAVSVGSRFHKINQPKMYMERIFTTWRSTRNGDPVRVLMAYAKEEARDQNCAKIISMLTGGNLVALVYKNEDIGHHILRKLLEFGVLSTFFKRTIFSQMDDMIINSRRLNAILSLGENKIQICK